MAANQETVCLSYEQQLAIFRQWPKGIVDDEFQLVDLITNFVEFRLYLVVVDNCLLVLAFNLVGKLAGIHQLLYAFLNSRSTLGNLLNNLEVTGI